MRIALLTSDLTYKHGWGNYSLNLIKSLQAHNHDLTILSARNSPQIEGIEIYPVLPSIDPPESQSLPKMFLQRNKIAKLIENCDVIHTTIELYAPLLPLISKGRPTFMTAHGSYINLPEIRRFPANWIFRRAFQQTHIISVSHYTDSVAQSLIPSAKRSVILNAVDVNHFADIERQPTNKPLVVSSGGVKFRKGTLYLVKAIAKVRESFPDVQCHIIGTLNAEPGYVEMVRAEIEALNLQDAVYLTGFVSATELRDYYAKADIFALPSINQGWKFEGFGLATLEASAAGLPVIGSRGCGAEDAIDEGKTGLLVSQDNIAEELPSAIIGLLDNPEKAAQMGVAGRIKAQSYTWDDIARQLISLYESKL